MHVSKTTSETRGSRTQTLNHPEPQPLEPDALNLKPHTQNPKP